MAKGDRQNVQSGLDDILGSVIKNDRRNSGRKVDDAPVAPLIPADNPEDPVDQIAITGGSDDDTSGKSRISDVENSVNGIIQYDNNTLTQYGNNTHSLESTEAIESSEGSLLQRRYEEAMALAASPTTTVTLRVPHALNDWMDEYLHGAWPEKIKKQELLIEALQLLYVRRGRPKEEILETELMPRSKK